MGLGSILALFLRPPPAVEIEALAQWRVVVAGLLMFCVFASVGGFFFYARASDIETIQTEQLDALIWESQRLKCISMPNTPLRNAYARRLQDLLGKYLAVTKQEYKLQSCSEFSLINGD